MTGQLLSNNRREVGFGTGQLETNASMGVRVVGRGVKRLGGMVGKAGREGVQTTGWRVDWGVLGSG